MTTTIQTTQLLRHCNVCGDDAVPVTCECTHCGDQYTDVNLYLCGWQLRADHGDRPGAEITCKCGCNNWQLAPDHEQTTLCAACGELLTKED